jgi:hypothetical protein
MTDDDVFSVNEFQPEVSSLCLEFPVMDKYASELN